MTSKTEFEKHGFFAVESLNLPNYISSTYGPYLSLFRQLNSIAWSMQRETEINSADYFKAWCFSLYSRSLNFIQSAFMLSVIGMRVQAEVQMRCALEALFKLGALKEDRSFFHTYHMVELKDQLTHTQSFINYLNRVKSNNKLLKAEAIKKCKEQKQELLSQLKLHKPDLFVDGKEKDAIKNFRIPISEFANKAGLLDWYDLIYRLGSAATHSDAKSIEYGHFIFTENNEIGGLKNEPQTEDLDDFVVTLCLFLFTTIESVCSVLSIAEPSAELNAIKDSLNKLTTK